VTRAEFTSAMAPLAVNFNRPLDKPLLTVFWGAFQHCTPDEFRDAVTEVIRTERFFPTVATLRDAMGLQEPVSTLAEAGAVFALLCQAGPKYDPHRGDYWPPQAVLDRFGPQALAAFTAAGGTTAFRDRTARDVAFLRRDFMKGWEEYGTHPTPPDRILRPSGTPTGLTTLAAAITNALPSPKEGA